eukprot:m.68547 g.68547  ORF g.68547 m.68547 type:complete len:147 (-) comp7750_c0_seq1:444-884(-)
MPAAEDNDEVVGTARLVLRCYRCEVDNRQFYALEQQAGALKDVPLDRLRSTSFVDQCEQAARAPGLVFFGLSSRYLPDLVEPADVANSGLLVMSFMRVPDGHQLSPAVGDFVVARSAVGGSSPPTTPAARALLLTQPIALSKLRFF